METTQVSIPFYRDWRQLFLLEVQRNLELVELSLVDGARCIDHHVATLVVLGECDGIADGIDFGKHRNDTIQAECKTSVRRCTILEGINQTAKLFHGLLLGEAKEFEHLLLQFRVVDTNRTATEFYAVHDAVVSPRTNLALIGVEEWDVLRIGAGERMMGSVVALCLLIPFEEREVDDPKGHID